MTIASLSSRSHSPSPGRIGPRPGRAGVHRDRAGAVRVGCTDRHPQFDGAAGREQQRAFDGQFLDSGAVHLVPGAQHEFDVAGAGEQRGAADGVVGEPAGRAGRQSAAEDDLLAVDGAEHGAEQGVVGGRQTGGLDVGGAAAGLQPVPAPLEGIGGQLGAAGPGPGEGRGPVHGDAPDVGLGERAQEPVAAALVAPQG